MRRALANFAPLREQLARVRQVSLKGAKFTKALLESQLGLRKPVARVEIQPNPDRVVATFAYGAGPVRSDPCQDLQRQCWLVPPPHRRIAKSPLNASVG